MRILVVEDDSGLQDLLVSGLRDGGSAVDVAVDGIEALEKAWVNGYDVIVLDRDVPSVDGGEICSEIIASGSHARILMLTASDRTEDCVDGLAMGADDHMTKPFEMPELLARVHALQRRQALPTPPKLIHGGIEVEPAKYSATRFGKELDLTRKEFGVLTTLMAAKDQVVSAEELLEKVWDENVDPFTNAIRMTIMTLRRKLGDPPVIETVTGVGYRLA